MNTKITTWGKQMARAFVLTMVLLLSSSASVFAGGTKYYDFYATLQAILQEQARSMLRNQLEARLRMMRQVTSMPT